MDGHENKDTIRYIWNFIYWYLLIERYMFILIQVIAEDSEQYVYCYKGFNPFDDSNDIYHMAEYHVDMLPQLQYILDKSGEKL